MDFADARVLCSFKSNFPCREVKKEAESLFAKSSRRDAAQVLANGGLAGLVVIVGEMFQRDAWYIAY